MQKRPVRNAGPWIGRRLRTILAISATLVLSGCSKSSGSSDIAVLADEEPITAPASFDWSKPEAALVMNADEAAARIGSFDWSAKVDWTVTKGSATPIRMAESHRLQQMKAGAFAVESDLDPDGVRRADSGKRVVYANKMTYARGRYAPFDAYRQRPTDRGRDARRYRDESYGLAGDLAGLFGSALVLTPAGETTLLSRSVKRFSLSLDGGKRRAARAPTKKVVHGADGVSADDDTQARMAFTKGQVPIEAQGELLVDAETGVLLSASVRGQFLVEGDPDVGIEVVLASQMNTIGDAVANVVPPPNYLPDQRKPRGVARALEAAGLRKPGGAGADLDEADEDGE